MKNHKSISLVCFDTIRYDKSIFAIKKTLECIDIDKIYWFSDIPLEFETNIPVEHIQIDKIDKDIFYYHTGILYTKIMPTYINTDFSLYIQSDGFAVNKNAWDDRFLDYDFIGAPWPFHQEDGNVGNGGFSIRSNKLHKALLELDIPLELLAREPEDYIICTIYKKELEEKHGIKFAPEELACKFSMETAYEYPKQAYNYWIGKSFGFHNFNVCHLYGYPFHTLK